MTLSMKTVKVTICAVNKSNKLYEIMKLLKLQVSRSKAYSTLFHDLRQSKKTF